MLKRTLFPKKNFMTNNQIIFQNEQSYYIFYQNMEFEFFETLHVNTVEYVNDQCHSKTLWRAKKPGPNYRLKNENKQKMAGC